MYEELRACGTGEPIIRGGHCGNTWGFQLHKFSQRCLPDPVCPTPVVQCVTQEVVVSLDDLIKALDDDSAGTTTSSVRQTIGLRRAVAEAVSMGLAESANDLTNEALRGVLDAFAQRQALEQIYAERPELRPTLAEVAAALAVIDRSPLVDRPDLLARAEQELAAWRPGAGAEDVLVWATSLLAHEAASAAVGA